MGTYNRGHLLARSLQGYARQAVPLSEIALIIIDDDSTDNTKEIVTSFADDHPNGPHIFYFHLKKPDGVKWRDSASFINMGISYAIYALSSSFVWATHPEIIPGANVLLAGQYAPWGHYCGFKGYYLTPDQQAAIDTVDWKINVTNVRDIPGFYDQHPEIEGPAKDYQHYNMDQHKVWESWIFGGFPAELWKKFGGLSEFNQWGSVDVDFFQRRKVINLPTFTPPGDHSFVIHQNHDGPNDVKTPRIMELALNGVPRYTGPESAKKPELLDPKRWLVNQSKI